MRNNRKKFIEPASVLPVVVVVAVAASLERSTTRTKSVCAATTTTHTHIGPTRRDATLRTHKRQRTLGVAVAVDVQVGEKKCVSHAPTTKERTTHRSNNNENSQDRTHKAAATTTNEAGPENVAKIISERALSHTHSLCVSLPLARTIGKP